MGAGEIQENTDYYHRQIKRSGKSGDFHASPRDPGMPDPEERTAGLFLTPYGSLISASRPVHPGAYNGRYIDKRRKAPKLGFKSPRSLIRNSALFRAGASIKNRITKGTNRIFFRNNHGGSRGSLFNSPSYGIPN